MIKSPPKPAKILLLMAGSFLAIHLAWYFAIMRNDLKYLFVWRHALSIGPDYAPSMIMWATILSFIAVWLVVLAIALFMKRRRRHAAGT
jgi:4-amino-4-deoxy-L-arabinose transferase-like glycosyltransferase